MTIQQKEYDPALAQGAANTVALPQTITDSTNSAFAVGPNGATNPVFQVDDSVSSAAVGVKMIGRATGTPGTLQVIGSGTNEGLDIKPKAAGNVRVYGQQQAVVSGSGATVTLTADQSGLAVFFDRAAGIVFTLPVPAVGLFFDFFVKTTITSNAAKIITDAGTTLLTGNILNIATDNTNALAAFVGNGSTHIAVSMNGTTTGGVKGDWLRLTALSTTLWSVQGRTTGTSTIATPFATS